MRLIAAFALSFSLAACSAPDDEPGSDHDDQGHEAPAPEDIPSGPGLPLVPDIADEADSEEDVAEEAQATQIPVNFRGTWDYEGGMCAPESDLRLDVEASAITFYESYGELVRVERVDPFAVSLELEMTGEGETWTQTLGLRLVNARMGLMVMDEQSPGEGEELIRRRCP
ncbi:MAG: hypothetical protein AAFZ11_03415 [Pseudomonadota bacterium]